MHHEMLFMAELKQLEYQKVDLRSFLLGTSPNMGAVCERRLVPGLGKASCAAQPCIRYPLSQRVRARLPRLGPDKVASSWGSARHHPLHRLTQTSLASPRQPSDRLPPHCPSTRPSPSGQSLSCAVWWATTGQGRRSCRLSLIWV